MANVAIIDVNTGAVLNYLTSVSSPDYKGRADVLINPNLKGVSGLPIQYWKHSKGTIVAMTAQEQFDYDAAIKLAETVASRVSAKQFFFSQSADGIIWRAMLTWIAGGAKAVDLPDAVSQIQQIIDSGVVDQ